MKKMMRHFDKCKPCKKAAKRHTMRYKMMIAGICVIAASGTVLGGCNMAQLGDYAEEGYEPGQTEQTFMSDPDASKIASTVETTAPSVEDVNNTDEAETTAPENLETETQDVGITFTHVNDYVFVLGTANLHVLPKDGSDVTAVLMNDTLLKRDGYNYEWSRIAYHGQEFYIETRYLRSPAADETFVDPNQENTMEESGVEDIATGTDQTESKPLEEDVNPGEETVAPGAFPEPETLSTPQEPLALDAIADLDNTTINWGYATDDRDELNRPNGCLYYQRLYGKYNADFIRTDSNQIYLTFDEGYENGYTAKILDTLKEKGVTAVFFVTLQYCKDEPDLVRRMIDEGHVVGNHTCAHPEGGMPQMGIDFTINDVATLHQYMLDEFDYRMYLFRYPEGAFSEQSLALLQNMGYRCVFWSFAHADWNPDAQPDVTESLNKVTNQMHPGAIYLLHAVSETNTTILGDFIDKAKDAGYTFGAY